MADIESLKRARKAKARAEKQIVAAENRTRYGRGKADKDRDDAKAAIEKNKLDGHKKHDK